MAVIQKVISVDGLIIRSLTVCKQRIWVSLVLFAVSFSMLGWRIVELASMSGEGAQRMFTRNVTYTASERPNIVDRNGVLLATNLTVASLYANPSKILDAEEATLALLEAFPDLSVKQVYKALSSDKQFMWIKRNLTPEEQKQVNRLGIPGIYFREEEKRVYPHGNLLAHVMGFVGTDGKGMMGIEKYMETNAQKYQEEPLQLTIDIRVQEALYTELERARAIFSAQGAVGIVQQVNSGEIMGLVSLPDFDPNNASQITSASTFNKATFGSYELGSTMKPLTMALALDKKVLSLDERLDATKPLRVGRHSISDHKPQNRWLTPKEIMMHSSNIGMARIIEKMGEKPQEKFMRALDFDKQLTFSLPETSAPLLPHRWAGIQAMTIAFGHGIALTPLHLTTAFSTLVNGGYKVVPALVAQESAGKGEQLLSSATSRIIARMLRDVVSEGTGGKANAMGYRVGGKTGTAEKLVNGRYDRKAKISSFIGVFPSDKPEYVVYVMLDEPQGTKDTFGYATGGFTAAPAVGKIIEQIAPMLDIMPVQEVTEHTTQPDISAQRPRSLALN